MIREAKLSAELLHPIPYSQAMNIVEFAGRTCYQSFASAAKSNQYGFIKGLIQKGHESVLEHVNISMVVKVDRGILAEWTRHRIGSAYSVASTRYINYSVKGMEYIMPTLPEMDDKEEAVKIKEALSEMIVDSLDAYRELIQSFDLPPQVARSILPQSFAVDMVVTHNIRQWRHVLKERLVNPAAHPDMRKIMRLCHELLVAKYPVFFEDIIIPD